MTGFNSKRQMAADKLQDGKCKYCVDGCIACDSRAQPVQEPVAHIVQSNGKYSPLLTHMMSKRTTPPQPAQEPTGMLHIDRLGQWLDASLKERKRPWVGLTDEDRKAALLAAYKEWECEELLLCAREDYLLIEQALKEKNTCT
jgi:hypothetical protein